MIRDGIYAFIAKKIFRKKLYVFWHGWDINYESAMPDGVRSFIRHTFFLADKMFVLAGRFRDSLRNWGFSKPVILISTCFEDELLNAGTERIHRPPFRLLFLSRVERTKGIFIALEAFRMAQLKSSIPMILTIAGDGGALKDAEQYVNAYGIQNVEFTGYLRGEAKKSLLERSNIFFFPTFYGEGMPCALLEAMGSGLPVITRNDGGIPDFFEHGRMGFLSDSLKPEIFADAIIALVSSPEKLLQTGIYNREYAKNHFTASLVARRIREALHLEP